MKQGRAYMHARVHARNGPDSACHSDCRPKQGNCQTTQGTSRLLHLLQAHAKDTSARQIVSCRGKANKPHNPTLYPRASFQWVSLA